MYESHHALKSDVSTECKHAFRSRPPLLLSIWLINVPRLDRDMADANASPPQPSLAPELRRTPTARGQEENEKRDQDREAVRSKTCLCRVLGSELVGSVAMQPCCEKDRWGQPLELEALPQTVNT